MCRIWLDDDFRQRRKYVYTKHGHEELLCEKYLIKKEN